MDDDLQINEGITDATPMASQQVAPAKASFSSSSPHSCNPLLGPKLATKDSIEDLLIHGTSGMLETCMAMTTHMHAGDKEPLTNHTPKISKFFKQFFLAI